MKINNPYKKAKERQKQIELSIKWIRCFPDLFNSNSGKLQILILDESKQSKYKDKTEKIY